jgi:hypothetical protein
MPPAENPDQANAPASFNEVFWKELTELRPGTYRDVAFTPARTFDPYPAQSENLKQLYALVGAPPSNGAEAPPPPLSALCLSGGGIRSATFNLGVIQALARIGILEKFDYLSSVSGGGYIAGWLRAWISRTSVENVVEELRRPDSGSNPLEPEPDAIDHLREYSNYLTPQLGLFSGDTWTAAAIVLRNLILNWLVIIPLLAAFIAIPQVLYLFVQSTVVNADTGEVLLGVALAIELIASISIYIHRRFARDSATPHGRIMALTVLPVFLAAGALSTAILGLDELWKTEAVPFALDEQHYRLAIFCAGWCLAVPFAGWLPVEFVYIMKYCRPERRLSHCRVLKYELLGLMVSGAVASALMFAMAKYWLHYLYKHPTVFVVLALPCLLSLYLLARTLFVAFASLSERGGEVATAMLNDADREWWARLSGWVLASAVIWVAITVACLFGQWLLTHMVTWGKYAIAAAGGLSGVAAAFLGGRDNGQSVDAQPSLGEKVALTCAAPLFALGLVLIISWGTSTLGQAMIGDQKSDIFKIQEGLVRYPYDLVWDDYRVFALFPAALFLLAAGAGWIVNVNRFSLHGFYRNRLVRAYLGASNSVRKPDPFTGFDPRDNIRLHDVMPATAVPRLLPIINMTLNLVRGSKLAWQQRKAESFAATPYYCGNFYEGYRASREYGGQGGITLGTAISISGAAANPNMGYTSSPALGFVMAMFNARLGAWLGNTNTHGKDTYKLPGPRQALQPLLAELFGLSTSNSGYISLSDGGHFDNLGLYEVVLRRCRYIVVSDSGCDGSGTFQDLGNAIRKIRIDFGIPIEFDRHIEIYPNRSDKVGLYCGIATIRYDVVDGSKAEPGQLVYIKPTMRARDDTSDYDVYSYWRSAPQFPHEPTSDQWFSESQFESYRMLGSHSVQHIAGGLCFDSLREFFSRVGTYSNPDKAAEVKE